MTDEDHISRMADAREIYQGTHQLTMSELSELTGIPPRVLSAEKRGSGWAKTVKSGQTPEAAQAVARFAKWKAETAAVATREAEAVPNLAEPLMDMELHKLLERHKAELIAPRALSQEALKIRNSDPNLAFLKAKLAKITAETLTLLHTAERRAWGVKDDESTGGKTVVIERD